MANFLDENRLTQYNERVNNKINDIKANVRNINANINNINSQIQNASTDINNIQINYLEKKEPRSLSVSPLFSYTKTYNSNSGDTWGMSQGMCFGDGKLIIAIRPKTNGVYNQNDKRTKICIIDIENGNILREGIVNTQYSNSLFYDSKTKQILTFDHTNIYVIDYDSLIITKTITITPSKIFGGIFIVDNQLCCATNDTVYNIKDDGTYTQRISFNPSFTIHPQSIAFNNGYYYVTNYYPNNVNVYDLNGNLVNQFNIPYNIQGMSLIELEDIAFNGEDVYMNFNSNYFNEDIINIVKTSIHGSNYLEGGVSSYINSTSTGSTLYLNQNAKSNLVGGTEEHPFKSIGESLSVGKALIGGFILSIQDGIYENARFIGQNVTIRMGENVKLINPIIDGGKVTIIGGIVEVSKDEGNFSDSIVSLIGTKLKGDKILKITDTRLNLNSIIDEFNSTINLHGISQVQGEFLSSIYSKIKKANKNSELLTEGYIPIDNINQGKICDIPENVKSLKIVLTITDNYKGEILVDKTNDNFTITSTFNVDQGAGYDTYVFNVNWNNTSLEIQKNVKFTHSNTGEITRVTTIDSNFPKVTGIFYR